MANQADFPVRTLCRVLDVSASGFYAWCARKPSTRAIHNAALTERIRAIHAASDGTYGRARIRAELLEEGTAVSRKRIARLMRVAGVRGVSRRRGFVVTTQRDASKARAPDLVRRRFAAQAPNELWVADMTYVPTWAGFIYLAVVIDVWSRRVVGWSIGEHMRTELVLGALNMAISTRKPTEVIHHSDQGSQYAALAVSAARTWACARRWAPWAMPTTTRWPRASSRASSASCSTGAPSKPKPRRGSPSSPGSRAGTTHAVVIPPSAICHR